MNIQLPTLIASKQFRAISPEALKAYLALRAEVLAPSMATTRLYRKQKEYVATLSVQAIALTCGLSELATRRVLDELVTKRWVQSKKIGRGDVVYLLGEFKNGSMGRWLTDKFQKAEPGDGEVSGGSGEAERSTEEASKDCTDGFGPAISNLMAQVKDDAQAIKEAETRRNGRKKTNLTAVPESRKVRMLAEMGLIETPE
jgi:hypothetical protein